MIIPFVRRHAASAAVALGAAIVGTLVAWRYHTLGLTLSHYDSRGHLIVARRIFDSITPGWQQIGAVWLPLPHVLNALPVQVDLFYRTGASAVAISIASYAIAAGAIAWIVLTITESASAAIAGALVFALNPNVLYLQATPMTEPLLLATMITAVAMLMAWSSTAGLESSAGLQACLSSRVVGWTFALACLTRYEAWPVTAAALAAAVWVRWRRGDGLALACRRVGAIAIYPAVALIAFSLFSRVVVGQWFVSDGFFVPENKALGQPMIAADEIAWGTESLSGPLLVAIGGAGAMLLLLLGLTRRRADALIALALVATAALPWAAFVKGHPFRIRYMVPLIAIEAVGAGVVAGLAGFIPGTATIAARRRRQAAGGLLLAVIVAAQLRPVDATAPMVVEAQWDRPNTPVRARVTACLDRPGQGEKIMANMGSLGHYMQEASLAGFNIRDFLHEGNGDIWLAALEGPRPYADWILIEEKAQGGDMLAHRAREQPSFLDGYQRTCEGAGLALYRRVP